ncbi:hypothetical protein CRG98_011550 [Punica granatum]|uniref:Lipid desaturase domain-containing protein n=1 Tax=Punica granatum TaxID=22663 RepID=A0A2I0KHH6_PUNGR|nr:hypothetical protein CRG98_011550 [Punica granatum]
MGVMIRVVTPPAGIERISNLRVLSIPEGEILNFGHHPPIGVAKPKTNGKLYPQPLFRHYMVSPSDLPISDLIWSIPFDSMSVLPQHKLFSSVNNPRPVVPCLVVRNGRVRCLAATTTTGPTGQKLESGKLVIVPVPTSTSTPPPDPPRVVTSPSPSPVRLATDDPSSLKSTWSHRAWVACGCTTVFVSLAKSVLLAAESHSWAGPILAGSVGYVLADLGSGVYHWGIDNYGDASTPFFGSQIEAFQGHHKWPWTITRREFANNLHALARAVAFSVLPIDLLCNDPTMLGFVAFFSGCIMFSQQFHAWAHGTKSRLPQLVVALQDAGILALEMVLFFKFGLQPRSWDEPSSEWTEDLEASAQIEA